MAATSVRRKVWQPFNVITRKHRRAHRNCAAETADTVLASSPFQSPDATCRGFAQTIPAPTRPSHRSTPLTWPKSQSGENGEKGVGAFGSVHAVKFDQLALKTINKRGDDEDDAVRRKATIMKIMDGANHVAQLVQIDEDEKHFRLFMELGKGHTTIYIKQ
ncbi:hypothetical protein HDU98_006596 [Podochytrium sp. JEL0797]|nr:hypothetical protein HDU98_006596 [Podochytrium sp. JEL0797]